MDDKDLLASLGNCDTAAFTELFERYGRYVAAVAIRTGSGLLTDEDVEEITADVFIRIWKLAENRQLTLKGDNLKGYIGASARNSALDYLRKKNRRIFTDQEDLDSPVSATVSAETEWLLTEDIRCLLDLVQNLPEPDQTICKRRYFQGEKIREIALALGMEESAVRVRLTRLRKKLRDNRQREEAQ